MDYFGKKPNLIGPIMKNAMDDIIQKPKINNTISDKVITSMSDIYTNYIYEYKFFIVIFLFFIAYLVYRYYKKNIAKEPFEEAKPKSKSKEDPKDLIQEFKEYQDSLIENENIHMNPIYPPDVQQQHINYPPDPLPVNIPDKGIIYTRDIYDHNYPKEQLNNVNYDYDNVYKNRRTYYEGTYNTYQNAKDTDIRNPFGWSNNFNTTSGKFVKGMTDANSQIVHDYQQIADNTNEHLINGLQGQTQYPEGMIEKPFAE